MIYNGITILDRNLKPLDSIGLGGDWKEKILNKITNWADSQNIKTVSVVRLVHPGEASAFGVDDVISIRNRETGTLKFGIWKVYGSTSAVPKGNPRGRHRYLDWKKATEEAAEELERKRKPTEEDYYTGAGQENPRKKEMKMGAPEKTTSIKKIIDEIDETTNEWRFRLLPPSKLHKDSYRSKDITLGVRAITGCPKGQWSEKNQRCYGLQGAIRGAHGIKFQALRLSKEIFKSKESAAKWIAKHTKPRRE